MATDRTEIVDYCVRHYGWDEPKAVLMVNECIDRFRY